jgi:hypothetical protein
MQVEFSDRGERAMATHEAGTYEEALAGALEVADVQP